MAQKIQIKRGLSTNLTDVTLTEGELGYTTDTKELYIGSPGGKVKIAKYSDVSSISTNGASVNDIQSYQIERIGELFAPPEFYNAWTPNGIQWDNTRGKWVGIINGANAHVFTTVDKYFYTVDPETLIATTPVKIIVKDGSGNTVNFAIQSAGSAFVVLNDGSYVFFTKGADAVTYNRVMSTDGGVTWVDKGAIIIDVPWATTWTFWAVYKLSTGRLLASLGGTSITKGKIMYSDDKGANWKAVTIGGSVITGNVTAAEPCFIDLGNGKVISLARKSTSGISYGTTGGAPDPALIATSSDSGATWTPYVNSTTILDMNASDAAAYVHNGMVEVFVGSRFYATTSNINTGQTGAIYHYTATIDNAFQDKFTLKGIVAYANSLDSVNFHSPAVGVDSKGRMLLTYMDESKYPQADVSHWFLRGDKGKVPYITHDGSKSPVFGYSGKYVEKLVSDLMSEVASLQYKVSQISGVTNPVPAPKGTLLWTKKYNANVEQIRIDQSSEYTSLKYLANTVVPSYLNLVNDSNGVAYTLLNASYALALPSTKNNLSISFKGKVGNALNAPMACVIINGTGYGVYSSNYGLDTASIHEFRFEYQNGVMKSTIDGLDVKTMTFPFDSTNVSMYSGIISAMGGSYDPSKKYVVHGGTGNASMVYELKMGEWD